jgi:hypothetical protein
MGELGALFNPGMRHELEERRARAARREEEGNARDGDLRIDLESGVAVINAPGDEDSADADHPASAEPVTSDSADIDSADTDSADTDSADVDSAGPAPGADPAAEPDPAPLRPRGKRAMCATRR